MAVKSVKVKLRLAEMPEIRAGLWHLHSTVNEGVKYYTEWLSLLRQGNLYRRSPNDGSRQECYMMAENCKAELLERLRHRQLKNGHKGQAGSDEELLSISQELYKLLVPQAVGGKGDAQQISRKYLSPLVDPAAVGGLGIAKAGNKPRWYRMREAGVPGWEEEKVKDIAKKAADPTADVLRAFDGFGLKPLFDVFTESKMSSVQWKPLRKNQAVRTFDRDMFQQAIERVMSWETWNQNVGGAYVKLIDQRERFWEKNFAGQEELVELVKQLEQEMKEESRGLQSVEESAHQITKRALRGADHVFEKWNKLPDSAPFELYDEEIKKVQGYNNRQFGSHDLFAKLAEPEFQVLWREDVSFVTRYAVYNSILKKIEYAKQFATFTLPNPVSNPIWARFDKLGGNIQKYEFLFNHFGAGQHAVRFQRMLSVENGFVKEVDDVIVPIAASRQLDRLLPVVNAETNVELIILDSAAPDQFHGEFGGAKIQYDRRVLGRKGKGREPNRLHGYHIHTTSASHRNFEIQTAEEFGDIYLNLSVRVQSQSATRGENRPPYTALFRIFGDTARTYVNYDRLEDYIQAHPDEGVPGSKGLRQGLRVMSVDLGLRTSASISVFRVATRDELQQDSNHRTPFFYPIAGVDNLVAVHERSHLIKMPGETDSKALRRVRETRHEALNQLHSQLAILKQIVRCGSEDPKVRARTWERLIGHGQETVLRTTIQWRDIYQVELAKLEVLYSTCSDKDWARAVDSAVRVLWRHMGTQVKDWRKEVKRRDKPKVKGYAKDAVGGNSIGQINYLNRQLRFLKSWSYFGKVSGQVIRAERDSEFAITLREHIEYAKKDRLKKLADRIIMEALGYVFELDGRNLRGWIAKYQPCQLILLEELSEYRFNNDRPPSENNQLMQWSHRGVFQELKNQAEMHDVLVGTMYSAFSSRFDARTGAPGVRCRRVPRRFVSNGNQESLPTWLTKFIDEYGVEREQLRADDLIPTGDGEFFVAPFGLDKDDFREIHADLNAAQNLQRRLWQDFDMSEIRLRCDKAKDNGETVLVPRVNSKRATTLYKKSVFVSSNDVTYYERQRGGKRQRIEYQDEVSVEELELFYEEEAREQSIVIIRDASGVINHGLWTSQHVFWSAVNNRIESYLLKKIRSREKGCTESK